MRLLRTFVASGLVLALSATGASAGTGTGSSPWTATWATALQRPSANFSPNWSEQGFAGHTVRQVVRVSAGGVAARIRLSNVYGTTPLKITGATLARPASGAAIRQETLRHITVDHARAFTIPAGAELASDPVLLPLADLESVAVTLYVANPTGPATYHAQSYATAYRASGDHRADPSPDAFTETSQAWYFLSGVDVITLRNNKGVAVFGDSIVEGFGSTMDANNRYPDELAERLDGRAVLNQGIGGNRITVDSAFLGDKGLARFRRDVLGQPGVGTVIVLEGINDIGFTEARFPLGAPHTEVTAEQVIAAHRDLIRLAHARQIKIIGATLLPFKGSAYYTERSEAKRDAINEWIRTSGEYDSVLDFDRVMTSPADPDQLAPAYDTGDHLHPNDAGYRAMGDATQPAVITIR
ncbi:MAG: SGNH/GDSL hydrolase family protein [Kibdelosporangium sp.]